MAPVASKAALTRQVNSPRCGPPKRPFDLSNLAHTCRTSMAESCRSMTPGGSRQGGEDRCVICEPGGAVGAAVAGHRGSDPRGQAPGASDPEGSDGPVSGGVGEAEGAVGCGQVIERGTPWCVVPLCLARPSAQYKNFAADCSANPADQSPQSHRNPDLHHRIWLVGVKALRRTGCAPACGLRTRLGGREGV